MRDISIKIRPHRMARTYFCEGKTRGGSGAISSSFTGQLPFELAIDPAHVQRRLESGGRSHRSQPAWQVSSAKVTCPVAVKWVSLAGGITQ